MRKSLLGLSLLSLLPVSSLVAVSDSIGTVEQHVNTLAAPEMQGRMTGSPGAAMAADYIAEQLEAMGAEPIPGQDDFRIPFEFTAGTVDEGSSLKVADQSYGEGKVRALSFSDADATEGEIVFAGYGLKVPDSGDFGYDSYATLDVKDKIVLVLRYIPEDAEPQFRRAMARYSGLRYKALTAREAGAKAILVVTGPRSPNAGELIPMTFDTAASGSGIPAATISGEVADVLFQSAGKGSLEEAQKDLDSGNPHAVGFSLGVSVKLDVKLRRERRKGYNVVALLGDTEREDKDFVMLGAHYDHIGTGRSGNSRATDLEATDIHYGADDNASGVAAVLDVGRQLAERDLGRAVVLAFWSGEELGLIGSTAFANGEVLEADELAAYLNFDMVGRMRDNKLMLQAIGSSPDWPKMVEQLNVRAGFDLMIQQDPYLPTDSSSFNSMEVPTMNFFTGSHDDYHTPADVAELINFEDLERVAEFGARLTARIADAEAAPEFELVERQRQDAGSRDTVRAYTGTIPDYGTEIEGLLLGGVMAGGPAEEAGLQKGDVIVQFGEQKIANIYDYTYALDAVKVDVPVQVIFLRDGERIEVTLTPRARK
ncbi:MAG: M28 family peptidase [Acidobacteriota bacterium]